MKYTHNDSLLMARYLHGLCNSTNADDLKKASSPGGAKTWAKLCESITEHSPAAIRTRYIRYVMGKEFKIAGLEQEIALYLLKRYDADFSDPDRKKDLSANCSAYDIVFDVDNFIIDYTRKDDLQTTAFIQPSDVQGGVAAAIRVAAPVVDSDSSSDDENDDDGPAWAARMAVRAALLLANDPSEQVTYTPSRRRCVPPHRPNAPCETWSHEDIMAAAAEEEEEAETPPARRRRKKAVKRPALPKKPAAASSRATTNGAAAAAARTTSSAAAVPRTTLKTAAALSAVSSRSTAEGAGVPLPSTSAAAARRKHLRETIVLSDSEDLEKPAAGIRGVEEKRIGAENGLYDLTAPSSSAASAARAVAPKSAAASDALKCTTDSADSADRSDKAASNSTTAACDAVAKIARDGSGPAAASVSTRPRGGISPHWMIIETSGSTAGAGRVLLETTTATTSARGPTTQVAKAKGDAPRSTSTNATMASAAAAAAAGPTQTAAAFSSSRLPSSTVAAVAANTHLARSMMTGDQRVPTDAAAEMDMVPSRKRTAARSSFKIIGEGEEVKRLAQEAAAAAESYANKIELARFEEIVCERRRRIQNTHDLNGEEDVEKTKATLRQCLLESLDLALKRNGC